MFREVARNGASEAALKRLVTGIEASEAIDLDTAAILLKVDKRIEFKQVMLQSLFADSFEPQERA